MVLAADRGVARGAASASADGTPHGDQLGGRSGALRVVTSEPVAPLGAGERHNRCTLREPSIAYEDRGPERRCPLTWRGPDRGTIQQT